MIYNCIKTTTTLAAIGTGNGTVLSAAAARSRPLSDIPVGTQVALRIEDDAGTAWELSLCTILSATTFSRDVVINGSSGPGQKVNFGSGAKTVQQVLTADEINSLTGVFDVPFSQSVSLARAGQAFMQQQAVSGPLTFAPAAAAVRGALVYLRLVADGANAPNFSAFKEWGGSLGYDNRSGIVNQVQFFHDGVDAWVSISQAVNAVPIVDTTAPSMVGALSQSNIGDNGFTVSWQAATDNVNVASYEFSINAGGSYTDTGKILSRTVTGLTASTAYEIRVRALDAAGNRSAPLSTTVTTSDAQTGNPATAPGAPTIGVATAGDGYVDVEFMPPASNGGATITEYTATLSTGEAATGASSPIRVPAANGTPRTAAVRATSSVGTGAPSAASNSVTPVAPPATTVRLNRAIAGCTESAGDPWRYTGSGGGATGTSVGAVSMVSLASRTNGAAVFRVDAAGGDFMAQIAPNQSAGAYSSSYNIYANAGVYKVLNGSANQTVLATVTPATGDLLKIEMVDKASAADYAVRVEFSVSKDGGVTWILLFAAAIGRNTAAHYARVVPGGATILSCLSAPGFA